MVWGSLYVFGFVVYLAQCTEWHYIPSRSSAVWSFSSLPFLHREPYEPEPTPMECMVDITNAFGVAVLQDNSYSRGNFAFSPYGVVSVLVVLYEGASGESAAQIQRAVGFPRDKDILRVGFRDIHRHLQSYFSHEGFLSGLAMNKETSSLKPKFKLILKFYGYDVDLLLPDNEKKQDKNTKIPDYGHTTASDTNEQVTSTIGNSITTNKMESFTTNPGDATTEASQSISASEISLTTQQDTMAKTEMTSQGTSTEEVESESNVMLTASTTLYPETIETTTIITTTTTKTDHNEMEDNENAIPNEEKPIDGEVMDKNKNQSETTLSTQIDYKTTSEMPEIQTQTQELPTSNKPNEENANIDNGMLIPQSVYFEPTSDGFSDMGTTTVTGEQESDPTTKTTTSGMPTNAYETTLPTITHKTSTELPKTTFEITTKTEETATNEGFSLSTTEKMKTTTELAASSESSDYDKSETTVTAESLEKTTQVSFDQSETSDSYSIPTTVQNLITTTTEKSNDLFENTAATLLSEIISTTSGTASETFPSTTNSIGTLEVLTSTEIISTTSVTPGETFPSTTHNVESTKEVLTSTFMSTSERNPDRTSLPTESSTMTTEATTTDRESTTETENFLITEKMFSTNLPTTEKHIETTAEDNTFPSAESSTTATEPTVANSIFTTEQETLTTNGKVSTENQTTTDAETTTSSLPSTLGESTHISDATALTTEQTSIDTVSTFGPSTVTTETPSQFFTTQTTSIADEMGFETTSVITSDAFPSTTLTTTKINDVVTVAEFTNLRNSLTNPSKRKRRESINNGLNGLEMSTKTIISGSLNLTKNILKNYGGSLRPKRTITDYLGSHIRPDINSQVQNSMYNNIVSENFESYENLPRLLFLVDGVIDLPVPMMISTNIFPYGYIPRLHCKALEFPLDDHRYKLLILLPLERRGLRQLLHDLGSCPLREVIKAIRPARVRTAIPSFMVDGLVVLTSTLQRLGIWDVFDPRKSNLSRMSTDSELYVQNLEQSVTVVIRNYVEILEIYEGTSPTRQVIYDFEVTHPFLYFVFDEATNVALMAGQVLDPLNPRIY